MSIEEIKAGLAAFNQSVSPNGTKMKLICIEGVIGVGKSTLTRDLAAIINAKPMFEPVDDNPYLTRFYDDPKRYALEMQFYLMSRRFQMHKEAIDHIWRTGQSVVMDRSIYGDWVFAKKNWLDGNIDAIGYESYLHHREVMNAQLLIPHIMLFLNADPLKCKLRIHTRGRECEKGVPIEYLKGLHDLHRELALEMKERGSRVINWDWNGFGTAMAVACYLKDS